MSTFSLEESWKPWGDLLPVADVARAIETPVRFSRENIMGIVPSIQLNVDAPAVRSLFLATESYLCEVSTDGVSFDFVHRGYVRLMRWELRTVAVKDDKGEVVASFETATLEVEHGPSLSSLFYVGNARERWIETVQTILPTSLIRNRG